MNSRVVPLIGTLSLVAAVLPAQQVSYSRAEQLLDWNTRTLVAGDEVRPACPTSFLLDRAGIVRHAVIGPLAPATLELAVRRLLDAPRPSIPAATAPPSTIPPD